MEVKISTNRSDGPNAEQFEGALSLERFGRYLRWAGGDRDQAIELYGLNTELSESLYTPLQMLEISLRNRIHTVMAAAHGEAWYNRDDLILLNRQRLQIANAKNDLVNEKKQIEPGRVVAALTFSFWTSMLGPDYEQLWRQGLYKIATTSLPRKHLSRPLGRIRTLRNRIAHHEPIIYWSLPQHYQQMVEITNLLSPPAAYWCLESCKFGDIWPDQGITLVEEPRNAS